jgi:hypothetical protein
LKQRVGQDDDSRIELFEFGLGGFRHDHCGDFAAAADCFVEQVKAFGDREAIVGEFVARDGAPHFAEERIGGAGDGLDAGHPVQC